MPSLTRIIKSYAAFATIFAAAVNAQSASEAPTDDDVAFSVSTKTVRFSRDVKAFGVQGMVQAGRFRFGAGPEYSNISERRQPGASATAELMKSPFSRLGAVAGGSVRLRGNGRVELGAQYHVHPPVATTALIVSPDDPRYGSLAVPTRMSLTGGTLVLTARIHPRWM